MSEHLDGRKDSFNDCYYSRLSMNCYVGNIIISNVPILYI